MPPPGQPCCGLGRRQFWQLLAGPELPEQLQAHKHAPGSCSCSVCNQTHELLVTIPGNRPGSGMGRKLQDGVAAAEGVCVHTSGCRCCHPDPRLSRQMPTSVVIRSEPGSLNNPQGLALPMPRGTCWGHVCGSGGLAPCCCTTLHLLHPSHRLFKTQEEEEVVVFWAGFGFILSEALPVSTSGGLGVRAGGY